MRPDADLIEVETWSPTRGEFRTGSDGDSDVDATDEQLLLAGIEPPVAVPLPGWMAALAAAGLALIARRLLAQRQIAK